MMLIAKFGKSQNDKGSPETGDSSNFRDLLKFTSTKTRAKGENTLFFVVLLFFLLIVIFLWEKTWDDSAITLAFSRNLAKYGDMIPSQFSDRVEGYSSFLWMVTNVTSFLFGLREETVLAIAKVLSTILALANIFLFWRLAREKIASPFYRFVILILYTINLQTVTSAVFGMETALYALLVLASYLLFENRMRSQIAYIAFTATASLLILIRHEGFLFLAPFVIETFLTNPKQFLREPFLYFWAGVIFTYHLWHLSYFGELLTNPMIAKGQPPYRPEFISFKDVISYYLYPFFRLIAIYPFLMLMFGITLIRARKYKDALSTNENPTFSLVNRIAFTGLFVMLITGRSWNADAERLSYPALAFLFLALAHTLDRIPLNQLMPDAKRGLTIILLLCALINLAATYRSFAVNRQFVFTVNEIRRDAQLVTLVQGALAMDTITFAGPDMGGLLLFEGDGKRVIDLGLLCNKELAKHGHKIIDEYVLRAEEPEIIEIHDNWVEPFITSLLFREKYFPVWVKTGDNEMFLFIRQDIVAKLEEDKKVKEMLFESEKETRADLSRLLVAYGRYLVLDLTDLETRANSMTPFQYDAIDITGNQTMGGRPRSTAFRQLPRRHLYDKYV